MVSKMNDSFWIDTRIDDTICVMTMMRLVKWKINGRLT